MKEKIDFIFIESIEPRSNTRSVFIGYLFPVGAAIIERGYTFKILSLAFLKDYSIRGLIEELGKFEFRAICMTTTADSIRYVYDICNKVKKAYPSVPIILGGPQASYDDIHVMEKCSCDFIIRNEGDYKNVDIMEEYYSNKEYSNIPGITWRKNGKTISNPSGRPLDINSLPTPYYQILYDPKLWVRPNGLSEKDFPDQLNKIRESYVFFMTGRGCPNKCSFCVEGNAGNIYRFRNVDKLKEDLISFLDNTGHKYVAIADDTFTSSLNRVRKVCSMFKEVQKERPFTWYCEGRVDVLTRHPEIIDIMVDAGLVALQIGVESGSQDVLDIYNKRITIEQIRNVILYTRKYPTLRIFGNIILGNPHETKGQLMDSLAVIDELVKLSHFKLEISTSILTPFVGTPIRSNSKEYGIEILYDHFEEVRFSFTDIVCKPETLTMTDIYLLKSIVEKHFQDLVNRELFCYDNVKKQVINLMSREKSTSVNIWLARSRVVSSAAFESYIELLSRKSAVLDVADYDNKEIMQMFPKALWQLDYNSHKDEYTFISLNGINYTLAGIDAYLWDEATGENSILDIYEKSKIEYDIVDFDYVLSFYKEMDKQLALILYTI